jgi:hypothetical protein
MHDVTPRHGPRKSQRKRKRKPNFDALRRREIERHARYVGAAETDDFDRWLIAWTWHNQQSNDPAWALQSAAQRMGGHLSKTDAVRVLEEADRGRHWTADRLARWLGLKYQARTALKITTIGACDPSRRRRQTQRRHRDRMYQERKRRAAGVRPQSESLSATQPWRELGMSRRSWYRRNKTRTGTTSSAALLYSLVDRVVPAERKRGLPGGADAPKQAALAGSDHDAADRHASLPVELRLLALGLPLPENLAAAAA